MLLRLRLVQVPGRRVRLARVRRRRGHARRRRRAAATGGGSNTGAEQEQEWPTKEAKLALVQEQPLAKVFFG